MGKGRKYSEEDAARDTGASHREVSRAWHQARDDAQSAGELAERAAHKLGLTPQQKRDIESSLGTYQLSTGETFLELADGLGVCTNGVFVLIHNSAMMCRSNFKRHYDAMNCQLRALGIGAHAHWIDRFSGMCPLHGDHASVAEEAQTIIDEAIRHGVVDQHELLAIANERLGLKHYHLGFEYFEIEELGAKRQLRWSYKIQFVDDFD